MAIHALAGCGWQLDDFGLMDDQTRLARIPGKEDGTTLDKCVRHLLVANAPTRQFGVNPVRTRQRIVQCKILRNWFNWGQCQLKIFNFLLFFNWGHSKNRRVYWVSAVCIRVLKSRCRQ